MKKPMRKVFTVGDCFVVFEEPGEANGKVVKIPRPRPAYGEVLSQFSLSGIVRYFFTVKKYYRRLRDLNSSRLLYERFNMESDAAGKMNLRIGDFFLNAKIVRDLDVSYELNGRTIHYRGWGYIQDLLAFAFNNSSPLNPELWERFIHIHRTLWRLGIGFGKSAETWGPRNWCLNQENELAVIDLSHLTDRKDVIESMLAEDVFNWRRERHLVRVPEEKRQIVNDYFQFLSRNLTVDSLLENWRKSITLE